MAVRPHSVKTSEMAPRPRVAAENGGRRTVNRAETVGHTQRINNTDALWLWHRITLETVLSDDPDLTSRQLALLTSVYLEDGPHTVRSLAGRLNVTKAVIVRAIDTLAGHQFVARRPDPRDKRSVVIVRTARGSSYLTRFAETIRAEMKLGRLRAVA